ncbi:hypothetical protein [Foetidibacter luteolus]|uniref:hypothetical protein n=1 Tax=Foetidibacter luteolus TaxID=2608880 RepID=UPI00129B30BE|nr:hypothetical protein [Foetidibacter luteolus]
MEILVFKTNVEDRKHVRKLFRILRAIQGILKWNVDLEDNDKVLRVEAVSLSPHAIENVMQRAGYYCKELEG